MADSKQNNASESRVTNTPMTDRAFEEFLDSVEPLWFKAAHAIESQVDPVEAALEQIKADGTNRIRCALTGAPVATIDDDEIRSFLCGHKKADKKQKFENLMDAWDLAFFAMSSRPGPSLMNRGEVTLLSFLNGNVHGYARLITFYLARLGYGVARAELKSPLERNVERLHFCLGWFDFLVEQDKDDLIPLAYSLASNDAWLSLDAWKELRLFNKQSTRNGINAEVNKPLKDFITDPTALDFSIESVKLVLASMLRIVVKSEQGRDVADKPTNRESMSVTNELAKALRLVEADSKEVHVFDPLAVAQAELQKYAEMKAEAKGGKTQAWSRTYGKGTLPQAKMPVKPKAEAKEKTHTYTAPTGKKKKGLTLDFSSLTGF